MIALICPVHNGLVYLKKYLPILMESVDLSGHAKDVLIVIVDDGSTDHTAEWLQQNYPQIIVLEGDGNLWWSGAMNMGIKHVLENHRCDYILLWNHDTKPAKEYFTELFAVIEKVDKSTIVLSKIYFLNRPNIIFNMGCLLDRNKGTMKLIGINEPDGQEYQKVYAVDWAGGMGTLMPRDIFGKIGFFDNENFPQYHGDSDFTLRAKYSGYKLLSFPNLRIWSDDSHTGRSHEGSFIKLLKTFSDIKSPYNIAVDCRFYRRHCSLIGSIFGLIRKYAYYFGGCLKMKIARRRS